MTKKQYYIFLYLERIICDLQEDYEKYLIKWFRADLEPYDHFEMMIALQKYNTAKAIANDIMQLL